MEHIKSFKKYKRVGKNYEDPDQLKIPFTPTTPVVPIDPIGPVKSSTPKEAKPIDPNMSSIDVVLEEIVNLFDVFRKRKIPRFSAPKISINKKIGDKYVIEVMTYMHEYHLNSSNLMLSYTDK